MLELFFLAIFIFIICLLFHHNVTFDATDVAGHYSLVGKIYQDFFINSGYIDHLGEMANYPPASHYLAASLNYFTGSGVVSMNLIDILALAIGWIVISKILLENNFIAFILTSISIFFILFNGFNLPIFGVEVNNGNFLYGQFVSTSYFICLIYLIYRLKLIFWQRLAFSSLGFFVGMFFHSSFALVYFSGSFIYFFTEILRLNRTKKFIPMKLLSPILIYGVLGAILFYLNPYTKFAATIRKHNGAVGFDFISGPYNLTVIGDSFIILCVLISILVIIFYFRNKKAGKEMNSNLILISSFLLGGSIIALMQRFLLEFGQVSPYVVKKNFFGMFTFFIITFSLLCEYYIISNVLFLRKIKLNYFVKLLFLPLISFVLIFYYWSKPIVNLPLLLNAQKVARDYRNLSRNDSSYHNTIAQFHELSMPMNWLITNGDLQVDKWSPLSAAIVLDLVNVLPKSAFVLSEVNPSLPDNGVLLQNYRVYTADNYNSPMIVESGNIIKLNNKNFSTHNILGKGFASPEPTGSWSVNKIAQIHFKIKDTKKNVNVTLTGHPWVSSRKDKIKVTILIDNEILSEKNFKANELFNWSFFIPMNKIDSSGNISLRLLFDDLISPLEDKKSLDDRKLGLHLQTLMVSY
ncbi:hypothetical protein [Candidatus Methylopumilus planktonicus]|uniref:hypothetical protein n=1 Tax=Candidatus Methylopumilus planktonicus TaxID=1581557 RepID=UPI003BEF0F17